MSEWQVSFDNERDMLAYALWTIWNNTEPQAIKHLDYDHLATNIADCAYSALKAAGIDPKTDYLVPLEEGPRQ